MLRDFGEPPGLPEVTKHGGWAEAAGGADAAAIVVAGGSGRRWRAAGGVGDKLDAVVGGRTVLDWTVTGILTVGLGARGGARDGALGGARDGVPGGARVGEVVCVGVQRPTSHPVRWCLEEPAGAGPVAAVAAALVHVSTPLVWVVAGDQPLVHLALDDLATALGAADEVAALVDDGGNVAHLAALWRSAALTTRLAAISGDRGAVRDAAMRELYAGARVALVPDVHHAAADADTPADLAELARRLTEGPATRRDPENRKRRLTPRMSDTPNEWHHESDTRE